MTKIVGGMKVAASRLARGMVSSANPGIYSKTYPEGSDPFDSVVDAAIEGSLKSSLKSSLKILETLGMKPTCTYDELSEKLGISRRAITKQIKKLRDAGKLRRVGPDKGGYWEVVADRGQ